MNIIIVTFFLVLTDISLDTLKIVATLGKGGFATVDLVHHLHKPSKTFALKRMKKQYIVEANQQQHILNERKILLDCDHQFICRLVLLPSDSWYT